MFEAMYSEYTLNPQITRSRMYYEAVSEILPDVKLYLDVSEGGIQKLLPIENFASVQTNVAPAANSTEGGTGE
jgi:membrane protease subunit HflK